jgi:carboxymethylenebutenolidase
MRALPRAWMIGRNASSTRGDAVSRIQEITIPLVGGSALPAALALPSGDAGTANPSAAGSAGRPAPRAGVLVIHEAIGLTDDIRRIAGRFADAGYVALAPDFLVGLGPVPFCIARFARGIGQVSVGRPYRQLAAAEAWLRGRPEVAGGPIGVAGFCMGGGFALLHAVGADVDVVAPFYAAVPKDGRDLAGVCPVVASYGRRDGIFGSGGDRLEAALTELGVEHDVVTYPEAGHGFMSRHEGIVARLERRLPTHGGYVEEAAEDAWRRTLTFFARHLGTGAGA